MRLRSFIPIGLFCAAVLMILLVAARAQEPQLPNRSTFDHIVQTSSPEKVIELVRAINAAEYDYHTDRNRFGSWYAVYAAEWRTLAPLASQRVLPSPSQAPRDVIKESSEVIPGYRLTLLVADDGATYSISLREAKTHGCGPSFFSDQSGLIYQGAVIDCPKSSTFLQAE